MVKYHRTLSKTVGIMRKTLTALLAATTLGVAALPSSAEARWGWGWGWGGFGVGLARGAIVGGALAAGAYNPYYGYGYGYPAYYPGYYSGYAPAHKMFE